MLVHHGTPGAHPTDPSRTNPPLRCAPRGPSSRSCPGGEADGSRRSLPARISGPRSSQDLPRSTHGQPADSRRPRSLQAPSKLRHDAAPRAPWETRHTAHRTGANEPGSGGRQRSARRGGARPSRRRGAPVSSREPGPHTPRPPPGPRAGPGSPGTAPAPPPRRHPHGAPTPALRNYGAAKPNAAGPTAAGRARRNKAARQRAAALRGRQREQPRGGRRPRPGPGEVTARGPPRRRETRRRAPALRTLTTGSSVMAAAGAENPGGRAHGSHSPPPASFEPAPKTAEGVG